MDVDRLNRLLKSIDDGMSKLRAGSAYRLVERNARGVPVVIDGYPSGSSGSSGGGDISNPTLAAVLARDSAGTDAEGHTHDPVADLVLQLAGKLETASSAVWAAVKAAGEGEHLATVDARKRPPTDCLGCGRTVLCNGDDILRGGHCEACDTAWRRYQKAERDAGNEPDLVVYRRQRPKVA